MINTINTINTFYVYDLFSGWYPLSVSTVYIASILFAISVITVRNPVISVLFLIGLFIIIGSYLILIGISFVGLSYLLVYVGAVSILFLFILMLINIRVSELTHDTKNSIPLVFLITLIFGNVSYTLLPQENQIFSWDIFSNALGNWDSYLAAVPHITSIGNIMYSNFAIWLIIISSVLLLAMVGAIVINIKQKTPKVQHLNFIEPLQKTTTLQSKLSF
uniref:NADH dehydrogenase subunit 6 n=1 Tax=Gyalideopsis ozarkensis TaxID=2910267 RepID=UPI001EE0FB3B|nr:NADH dehydrogenase subunit 6 [Gyalideopsis ozarkensis]UIX51999.1 NADH dehydrogenase subunit 6 [Gyalideopsis ozarkensis]